MKKCGNPKDFMDSQVNILLIIILKCNIRNAFRSLSVYNWKIHSSVAKQCDNLVFITCKLWVVSYVLYFSNFWVANPGPLKMLNYSYYSTHWPAIFNSGCWLYLLYRCLPYTFQWSEWNDKSILYILTAAKWFLFGILCSFKWL